MESTDSRRALAEWARGSDMDQSEISAMEACLGVSGGSDFALEIAWGPLAAWGMEPEAWGLRKLARIARGRQLMRDWGSELSWEQDPIQKGKLRQACQELALMCSQPREALAWRGALEIGAMACIEKWGGKIVSILRRGPGDRAARSALMGALGSWVDEEQQAMAASRAMAWIQARQIEEASGQARQGSSEDQGRSRL